VGLFAILEYSNFKQSRRDFVANSVDLAVTNILNGLNEGRNMRPYLNFLERYLEDSPLEEMSMSIIDNQTGKLRYSRGKLILEVPKQLPEAEEVQLVDGTITRRLYDVKLSDGTKLFIYDQGQTTDGTVTIHTYLPHNVIVDQMLSVGYMFWVIVVFVLAAGTFIAWVITAHMAKNITLLQDFATRAANDRDFIPMGDFPANEIGDISRQIVAIYNARMQANVRREREHAIALRATEEKNLMKRRMTDNISHELKTPIGIVKSYIETILDNPDMTDTDRTHFLNKAHDNIERLTQMMEELSTITRLEDSRDNIQISDIDFHDFVFSTAEDFLQGGMLGDIDFTYNIPLDCHVYGNGELLNTVLHNLAKNAVKYAQCSQIGITLLGRNENYFTFSFYDNGVGVGEEHLPHLFDRFYRIDSGRSRKVGGSGLGLPIVKGAINTMGGSITVRNRHGGGLEFVFTLRRVKPEKPKPQEAPEADSPAEPIAPEQPSEE
jgi:signal transduction histidine kinase